MASTDTYPSALPVACATLRAMFNPHETDTGKQQRIDRDLEALRILAWLVQRNRYSAEPMRIEGGRRGKARIATFTFYAEAADLAEAREAVREIVRRRAG